MMTRTATVFIVDDDASARIGLGRLLRIAGYDVKLYSDASAFLAEVCETPNACIVLDLRMPGVAGVSLQTELSSKGIFMPVIIVTADEDPDTRQQAKQAGAVAFFRKPVDGPALLDAIEWAISNREE
jgi:FixJ family two-component response regulator